MILIDDFTLLSSGYQLFYYGTDNRRNGVGIILDPGLKKGILEVNRESDRLISIKIQLDNVVINIASAYAPQTGCDEGEKDEFWDKLGSVIQSVPSLEVLLVCGHLNGHVGEGNNGSSDCMGKHGVGVRNEDGDRIVYWQQQERQQQHSDRLYCMQKATVERCGECGETTQTANKQDQKKGHGRTNKALRITKQRHKNSQDVYQAKTIKNASGNILISDEEIKNRWKEYFKHLMNVENEREKREIPPFEGEPVNRITRNEVKAALKKMKNGKSVGPDNIPAETLHRFFLLHIPFTSPPVVKKTKESKPWYFESSGSRQRLKAFWGRTLKIFTV
ncbi:uncharacterized protein LOC122247719 [Penaeus japonicus]|uniref:uncharacterized protein LOC122247719 n=1 Tax=Penaeus japonicus TaxID=27405 RepID=UPI001C70F0FF|nr:uncharacterized protein LOC122247719 [Penaeus japonicus]